MDHSFNIHLVRIYKMYAVVCRLNDLYKLPESFNIPDDIIDSSPVSELVNYVISNYHA